VAAAGVLLGSVGTVAYTARMVLGGFLGRPRSEGARTAHEPPAGLIAGPCLLAALGVLAWAAPGCLDRGLGAPPGALVGRRPGPHLEILPPLEAPLVASLVVVALGLLTWALLRRRLLPHTSLELLHRSLRATARAGVLTDVLLTGLR